MTKRAEYWEAHVKAVSLVAMPLSEYAKRHGLAVKSLYYWRRKLGVPSYLSQRADNPAKPMPSGKFVALQVTTPRPVNYALAWPSGLRLEMSSLPSTEWLVDLAREVQQAAEGVS